MKQVILFATFLLLLAACGNVKNKTERNREGQLVLVFDEQSSSSFFSDRIFGKVEIMPLETTDDCLVGNEPELLSDDHNFFVFDRQQQFVLRFDKSGKFINQIGRRGGGPEEYLDILCFDIDTVSNTVEILAPAGQILRYKYDGTFISSQKYDMKYLTSFIKTGTTYWFNINATKFSEDGHLLKVSEDGTVIEKYLPIKTDWILPVGELNFSRCGNWISFKETFNNMVYLLTDDGPVGTTVIDFGKYAIPQNSYKDDFQSVFRDLEMKGWATIYRYLENEQFIYIDFKIQQNRKIIGTYYWLINKNTGNSVMQKLSIDEPLYKMMKEAMILTTDNKLIFMANAQMLKECTDPFFSNANRIGNSLPEDVNPVVIALKINGF